MSTNWQDIVKFNWFSLERRNFLRFSFYLIVDILWNKDHFILNPTLRLIVVDSGLQLDYCLFGEERTKKIERKKERKKEKRTKNEDSKLFARCFVVRCTVKKHYVWEYKNGF